MYDQFDNEYLMLITVSKKKRRKWYKKKKWLDLIY